MKALSEGILNWAREKKHYWELPAAARRECDRDAQGWPTRDLSPEVAIAEGVRWLGRAQDHSASADGGVARHFGLIGGWSPSYPETTGYIIPTMLAYAAVYGDAAARMRARRMLDWLVSIQLPGGGFQGGYIGQRPVVPVTFNTGQILLGLAAGHAEFGTYPEPTRRAADWLVETQDADGCWRRHPTPFAEAGEKAYETHVAWGLLEAARVVPEARERYAAAALANIRWALGHQRANGWFAKNCLSRPEQPLTHTIGYVLRGVLEGYLFSGDDALLRAACRTADGVLTALPATGQLPGRLDEHWRATVPWSCLTGTAQIAYCWLRLYQLTGDRRYRDAGFVANRSIRRTIDIDGPADRRGGVKGSFPISGDYGRFEYLNWACKFAIDANLLELEVRRSEPPATDPARGDA